MIEFNFESQTADFVHPRPAGNPLDVLCSGDDPADLSPRPGGLVGRLRGVFEHAGRNRPDAGGAGHPGGDLHHGWRLWGGDRGRGNPSGPDAQHQHRQCRRPVSLLGARPVDRNAGWGRLVRRLWGMRDPGRLFDPAVGAGTFAAEYTYGTVCTATGTVAVNVGEAVAAEPGGLGLLRIHRFCSTGR